MCVCVLQLKLKQAVLTSMNPFYATVPSLAGFSSQAELSHMAWDKDCLDRYEKTCLLDVMKVSFLQRKNQNKIRLVYCYDPPVFCSLALM